MTRYGPHWSVIDDSRYKYKLDSAFNHALEHFDPEYLRHAKIERDEIKWVHLYSGGLLHVARNYRWDGASGPALDTMNMAAASLVHDALYQLIAAGELPMNPWKGHADREFYRLMREDGVPLWRAAYAFAAVRLFGRAREKYRA